VHEPPDLTDEVNAGSDQARMVLRRMAKVSAPERRAVSDPPSVSRTPLIL